MKTCWERVLPMLHRIILATLTLADTMLRAQPGWAQKEECPTLNLNEIEELHIRAFDPELC
jgi:hypothetical protein